MSPRTLLGLLVLLVLTACGGAGATNTGSAPTAGEAFSVTAASAAAEAAFDSVAGGQAQAAETSGDQSHAAQNAQANAQRLVIRTADVQLLVADVDRAEAQIRELADAREGYVLSSQSSGEGTERTARISFKIPVARFDETLTAVGALAEEIEGQNVQGQDVTEEYVDLESQLRNLRDVEARLLQFLRDAQRVDDLLTINQELSNVQGQIEQIEGRRQYLERSAAFSTINVSLRATVVPSVALEADWSPVAIARGAANSLLGLGQAVASLLIVLAVWTPVWLPLLLIGVWLRRGWGSPARP